MADLRQSVRKERVRLRKADREAPRATAPPALPRPSPEPLPKSWTAASSPSTRRRGRHPIVRTRPRCAWRRRSDTGASPRRA